MVASSEARSVPSKARCRYFLHGFDDTPLPSLAKAPNPYESEWEIAAEI